MHKVRQPLTRYVKAKKQQTLRRTRLRNGVKAAERTMKKTGKTRFTYQNGTKVVKMRSSWEVKYALHLDAQRIEWIYEPRGFRTDYGVYFPDFYWVKQDEWQEVKGYMTEIARKKMMSFRHHYPDETLVLLTADRLVGII